MQTCKTTEFNPANYLDSKEVIAEYLRLALASGDIGLLLSALNDIALANTLVKTA